MQRHLNCNSCCRCDGFLSLGTLGYTVCRWRSVMGETEKKSERWLDGDSSSRETDTERGHYTLSSFPTSGFPSTRTPPATQHSLGNSFKKMSQMNPRKEPPANIVFMTASTGNCSLNLRITSVLTLTLQASQTHLRFAVSHPVTGHITARSSSCPSIYTSFLGLLSPSTTNWCLKTTEMSCLTFLETRSPK